MLTGKSKDELKSVIENHFGVSLIPYKNPNPRVNKDWKEQKLKAIFDVVGTTGRRLCQVELYNPKYKPDWEIKGWTWNPDLEVKQTEEFQVYTSAPAF